MPFIKGHTYHKPAKLSSLNYNTELSNPPVGFCISETPEMISSGAASILRNFAISYFVLDLHLRWRTTYI